MHFIRFWPRFATPYFLIFTFNYSYLTYLELLQSAKFFDISLNWRYFLLYVRKCLRCAKKYVCHVCHESYTACQNGFKCKGIFEFLGCRCWMCNRVQLPITYPLFEVHKKGTFPQSTLVSILRVPNALIWTLYQIRISLLCVIFWRIRMPDVK